MSKTKDQQLKKAAAKVCRAFVDKGIYPAYHDQQMRHLETHWASLFIAVKDLAELAKEIENESK